MEKHNCIEGVLKCLVLIIALVLLVWLCLIPSRYSDGRIPEEVAREMYDANFDIPSIGGTYEND